MNHHHFHGFAITLIFGLTLACVMPGLAAQPPAATLDANSLSTAIAGTSAALAAQTAQAVPLTDTQPPQPTQTVAPTETFTVTPETSSEGTSLGKQSDGSYIFTDYLGGYSVVVPTGWLALRLNQKEFVNAWGLPETSDPNIQHYLTQIQSDDPKVFRLFGLDTLSDHLRTNFVTNFSVGWDRTNTLTIEQNISSLKEGLSQSIFETKVTDATIGTTSTQIPIGVVEGGSKVTLTSGQILNIYQKQFLLHGKSGLLIFTLSTVSSLKDNIAPGFNTMVDGIKMLP